MRGPDISILAISYQRCAINAVPEAMMQMLHECEVSCRCAEDLLKDLVENVSDDLYPGTSEHRYYS